MSRVHHKHTSNFTIISNTFITNTKLSYKARGLFLYLWSLPPYWEISLADLARHSEEDGARAIRSGIAELEKHGYVSIVRVHGDDGKFIDTDWILDDEPSSDKPSLQNAIMGNSGTYNTKDLKTEDLTKEELSSTILYGTAASSLPQPTNEHQEVATLSKKKKPKEVKPLPEDDWLKALLLEYTDSFDVAALDDNAWWTDTGNSFPTFTREWVSMAFASLARWFRENPKRVPRQSRYWKQRMNFSLNWYYDKHIRRT